MFLAQNQGIGIRQGQGQRLGLSVAMRQSLEVLKMPQQELGAYLAAQIDENPLLELGLVRKEEVEGEPFNPSLPDEPDMEEVKWEGLFAYGAGRNDDGKGRGPVLDLERLAVPLEESYRINLHHQLGTMAMPEYQRWLCGYLVDCLDRRGYLAFQLEDIASETGAPAFEVEQALYLLQSLTPTGTAARSLSECLILQLAQGPHFYGETVRLVKEGLPLLARNDYKGLATLLKCSEGEAAYYAAVIRGLNPIPSQGYGDEETRGAALPDAMVKEVGGRLVVEINGQGLPPLALNEQYLSLMGQSCDKETQNYLQAQKQRAEALMGAVKERGSTLGRVVATVAEAQWVFFTGRGGLVPMTLADIAERLGMHPSTISRAVQDKVIVCPKGTVPLKQLFTAALPTKNHGWVSSAVVKSRIELFIKAEDSRRPLSDEGLRQALAAAGMEVSRRTVAKYRCALGIEKASLRRRRG